MWEQILSVRPGIRKVMVDHSGFIDIEHTYHRVLIQCISLSNWQWL